MWIDRKTGATADRPGLSAMLGYARDGDIIVTATLDRLGRNLGDCLNIVHELRGRGITVRTLKDPLAIDTGDDSAMAQVATAMLALSAEVGRVFARERAVHARAVREANGSPTGRQPVLTGKNREVALAAVRSGVGAAGGSRSWGVQGHPLPCCAGRRRWHKFTAEERYSMRRSVWQRFGVAAAAGSLVVARPVTPTATPAPPRPPRLTPRLLPRAHRLHHRSSR